MNKFGEIPAVPAPYLPKSTPNSILRIKHAINCDTQILMIFLKLLLFVVIIMTQNCNLHCMMHIISQIATSLVPVDNSIKHYKVMMH
ncbi:MAG: hypothetical protein DM484_13425 [Candidatus Methylumidiphilus alinenensis]|uniref:Uncharacterized protein n=1 Tax=Candidatus Methylumidiphilus alinenensis TaxID=2202197 RepID=A0A2W4SZS1_9GAMM|nr:MAG: hypothetical protein DM484_13425 [Candidatus Methylumidiphilus alinenensis]